MAAKIVRDIDRTPFWVVRRAPTEHGFDLLHGRRLGGRSNAIILTVRLAVHLRKAHRRAVDPGLPISRPALARLRKRLGIQREAPKVRPAAWWAAHKAELREWSTARFARRYSVTRTTVARWKRKFYEIGRAHV